MTDVLGDAEVRHDAIVVHLLTSLLRIAAGAAHVMAESNCTFAAVAAPSDDVMPLVVQPWGADEMPPLRLIDEALRAARDNDGVWHFETTNAHGALPKAAAEAGFRSIVLVPLNVASARGCIAAFDRRRGRFRVSSMHALRRLARFTERAIDDANAERRNLARELHDGFAQTLTGLIFATDAVERACDGAEQRQPVQSLRSYGVKAMSQARALVDLVASGRRSVADPAYGFVDRLQELSSDGGVTRCTVDVNVLSLSAPARACLFHVAQEALLNVRRHANAKRIEVSIGRRDSAVELVVADDGRGFDHADATEGGWRGFGLRSMRDRVEESGGTFELQSAPDKGTRISVRLPL